MGKFLAIFNGSATEEERGSLTPEANAEFLHRWAAWADSVGDSLVDPGAPLHQKIRLTSTGADRFEDTKVAYAIVEAPSQEQALQMFATHPHLGLLPGNSIDVLECPSPPA
ncbi:hypothetical protein NYP18_02300 [Corynebacterium sp. YIM 101645]|uniref:YCII-related domain-containing protein n=1 Tax=Corynebacterium lemuris TaxID=1859292 RepID=A0ABT2FTD2_9CORY|nr:hypothetical protein [Corynebacterium lemuris]MCS5478478.1 hypothetical protein [Corynebacterium lemuris]